MNGTLRSLVIGLALMLVAFLTTGCAPRVAGGSDVELTYEMEEEPAATAFGQDVRALVLRRLAAA
jgi:predicted small secreted protein